MRGSKLTNQRERKGKMDSESEMIPCIDFGKNGGVTLEEGSEGWKEMSKKVREACESHGCFLLMCDEISSNLREEVFMGMKTLFDFPEEVKRKHTSPKTYTFGFEKGTHAPQCESFRIVDSTLPTFAHAFTNLMWPQGNPSFCEALYSMSSKMMELSSFILKMILEDYGLPEHYTLDVEDLKSSSDARLNKYYEIPENNNNSDIALISHTDRGTMTILCDNDVQGLQVLTKTGKWIDIDIPSNGFVVIVGDILKAWSNGRVEAVRHKVVMKGDKVRYSFVAFAQPKEDIVIKVPPQLVDKDHPLRYKSFKLKDFFQYRLSIPKQDNALEQFAGL